MGSAQTFVKCEKNSYDRKKSACFSSSKLTSDFYSSVHDSVNWEIYLDSLWIVSSVGKAKEIKNFKKAGGFKLKFEIGGLWPRPRKANIHGSERKKCPRWKGKIKIREITF